MDTGKGTFEQVTAPDEDALIRIMGGLEAKYPNHGGWFREGETVELNGSTFRVKRVRPTEIVLKLLERAK